MRPSLFGPPPAVVGHRGAPLRQRENTAASFAAAAAEGATWVELDVRLSADGHAIVHHDPVLPDGRVLAQMDLATCRAAGVESLADVLVDLPDGLGIDVEVKNVPGEPDHDESMAVVAVLARLLAAVDRPMVLTSFNPLVLVAAAAEGMTCPTGLLTYATALPLAIATAVELGCAAVCPHDTTDGLDGAGITAAHDAGLSVLVWTVDDPARMRVLATLGVDAICTNDPAGAVRALAPAA